MTGPEIGRATRLRRRLNRVLWSMWTTRVLYFAVCTFWLYLLLTADGNWERVVAVLVLMLMAAVLALSERRRWEAERVKWLVAAGRPDPVLYLARSDFQNGLTLRESMTLAEWHMNHLAEHHGRPPTEEEIAAAPPVVAEYYAIGTNPPQETR